MITDSIFSQLTAPLSDSVIVIDANSRVVFVSSVFERTFGHLGEALIGNRLDSVLVEPIDSLDETNRVLVRTTNHKIISCELNTSQLLTDNQSYHVVVLKRSTEESNTPDSELYNHARKVNLLGNWELDIKSSKVSWSPEVYEIHNLSPEEYTPELDSALNLYHPDDRELVTAEINKATSAVSDFSFQARIITPAGSIRYIRVSGGSRTNVVGELNQVIGVIQDNTNEVQSFNSLRKQNEFLDLIMSNIPDYLFIKDSQFKIVQANKSFLNLYPEGKRDKVIGYTTFEDYVPEAVSKFLKHDKLAFEDGETDYEETIVFPNGEKRTLFTKKKRFESVDGNVYILGLSRDITQLKKAEEDLILANSELEEFAYRTSHDLRSPLISSISLLDIAKESLVTEDLETANTSLNHISNSLKKLDILVKDILNLSKTKHAEEEKVVLDIEDLVEQSLVNMSSMKNFERIVIEKTYENVEKLRIKKSRLQLIVENLISNAIKYQDTSEHLSSIGISARLVDSEFIFQVHDNGLGIPPGREEKLFTMFQRFHGEITFGSGLGLYMVKKSAEILGGEICYERLEKGSLFKLVIPECSIR